MITSTTFQAQPRTVFARPDSPLRGQSTNAGWRQVGRVGQAAGVVAISRMHLANDAKPAAAANGAMVTVDAVAKAYAAKRAAPPRAEPR